MEVLNDRESVLTNSEVLNLLQIAKKEEDAKDKPFRTRGLYLVAESVKMSFFSFYKFIYI